MTDKQAKTDAPDSQKFDAELWAELYTLRAAVKGPEGYTSWQDAAVDERMKRHAKERELAAERAEVVRLRGELKDLMRAYVSLLETGRDRIVSAGGQCDPVDVMEAADPALRKARAALATPTQGEKS